MWGGRYKLGPSEIMERINASIGFDKRLYAQDIAGSMAHCDMLVAQGILTAADGRAIRRGLARVRASFGIGTGGHALTLRFDPRMSLEAMTGYVASVYDVSSGGTAVASCPSTLTLSCTISGLTASTNYWIEVVATNAVGSTSSARTATTTTSGMTTAPTAPGTPTATPAATSVLAIAALVLRQVAAQTLFDRFPLGLPPGERVTQHG